MSHQARCVLSIRHLALQSGNFYALCRWGIVVLGFRTYARPTSILPHHDIGLGVLHITLQLIKFKYGEFGAAPRMALCVPHPPGTQNFVYDLFLALSANFVSPASHAFADVFGKPLLAKTPLQTVMGLSVLTRPMTGTSERARSLCSVGIPAAYSVGMTLPVQ